VYRFFVLLMPFFRAGLSERGIYYRTTNSRGRDRMAIKFGLTLNFCGH